MTQVLTENIRLGWKVFAGPDAIGEVAYIKDHELGVKSGRLVIEARRQKDSILIAVADDGGGIDLEKVRRRAVEAGLLHEDLADDVPADCLSRPATARVSGTSPVMSRAVCDGAP